MIDTLGTKKDKQIFLQFNLLGRIVRIYQNKTIIRRQLSLLFLLKQPSEKTRILPKCNLTKVKQRKNKFTVTSCL
jgi:hypothetical protein